MCSQKQLLFSVFVNLHSGKTVALKRLVLKDQPRREQTELRFVQLQLGEHLHKVVHFAEKSGIGGRVAIRTKGNLVVALWVKVHWLAGVGEKFCKQVNGG